MYTKKVLNKLRILSIPLKNTKTVTVLLMVKVGSKNESKKINGISHFLEHMFFKGTFKRPSALDIAKIFDQIGGEYNAFTSQEYTGFYAKVNYRHWNIALDVLLDMLSNSQFKNDEIEKEKGVIIEEINMYRDTPMDYISTLWNQVLYGDQPAGWDILGTKEVVSALTRDDMVKYYKKHYILENIVLCISGNLEKIKEAQKNKIISNFSSLNERAGSSCRFQIGGTKRKRVSAAQNKPKILLNYKKTDQTHLVVGVRGYDMFHKDRFAIKLLSIILGAGMSSRLFIEIREKRGLAYYVYTRSENDEDSGYLATGAGLDNKKVPEALKIILDEYDKIRSKGLAAGELDKAKEYLKGKLTLNLESSDEWANFIASQELMRGEILGLDDIFDKVDKVTENDIKRIAKDIFASKKLNLALIGPFKDKKVFEKILKVNKL